MTNVYVETTDYTGSAEPPVLRVDDRRGTFGMALFIVSEALLFAILFFVYFYSRSGNDAWPVHEPPKLHFTLPMLGVMLLSSGVIYWGEKQVTMLRYAAARAALIATIALGGGFIALTCFEYSEHLRTLTPQTDAYGSIFYTITSLHLAHVILGLLMLLWVLFLPRWEPARSTPHRPYHNVSMYWHFVDVVWIFVVLLLYVIPNLRGAP